MARLEKIFDKDLATEFGDFVTNGDRRDQNLSFMFPPNASKEVRTQVHTIFKEHFPVVFSLTDKLRPGQEYTFGVQARAGAKRKRNEDAKPPTEDQSAASSVQEESPKKEDVTDDSDESAAKKQKLDTEQKSDTPPAASSSDSAAMSTSNNEDSSIATSAAPTAVQNGASKPSESTEEKSLVSEATTEAPLQAIRVKFVGQSKRRGNLRRSWPGGSEKKFLRFVLHKENMETSRAIGVCQDRVGRFKKSFGFAGNKDKRGVTCQFITAQKIYARDVQHALANSGVTAGNFEYVADALRLGDLNGNRFTIVLRDVHSLANADTATDKDVVMEDAEQKTEEGEGNDGASTPTPAPGSPEEKAFDERLRQAFSKLKEQGFVNYFGMQRFGTGSVATHEVGKAALKKQWERVAALIVMPRHGDNEKCDVPRKEFVSTGDIGAAIRNLPNFLAAERKILGSLYEKGGDFVRAFGAIPRTLRLMYLHAYQSYIWNQVASWRLTTHGFAPIVGDLVYANKGANADAKTAEGNASGDVDADGDQEMKGDEPSSSHKDGDEPSPSHKDGNEPSPSQNGGGRSKRSFSLADVHVLTDEDVASSKYTIEDVVLPIPGHSVTYSDLLKAKYEELIKVDEITFDMFKNRDNVLDLAGDYRSLLVVPKDVSWRSLRYNDFTVPLVRSSKDRLLDKEGSDPESIEDGALKAYVLSFSLPSSSYATMLLREVSRIETSQKELKKSNPVPVLPENTDAATDTPAPDDTTAIAGESNATESKSSAGTTTVDGAADDRQSLTSQPQSSDTAGSVETSAEGATNAAPTAEKEACAGS